MREPGITCPTIDANITYMKDAWEEIRGLNIEIREWGQYWLDKYEKLEKDSSNEIESLSDTIKDLESTISDLRVEIAELSKEIA